MIKKNKGGKIILVTGILAIAIVTICAFEKDNITRKYYEYTIDKKYATTDVNDYSLEDNFNYVNNYTGTGIKNNEELIGFIYYTLNSGSTYVERYIDDNYTNYNSDIAFLTMNDGKGFKDTVSILLFIHIIVLIILTLVTAVIIK